MTKLLTEASLLVRRELVVVLELRLLRGTRGGAFASHDPLDRCHDVFAQRGVVGAQVQQQLRPVRDDVGLRTGVEGTDGDHRELPGPCFPGHDGLQPQHDRGRQHDGVHRVMRHGAVGRRGRGP